MKKYLLLTIITSLLISTAWADTAKRCQGGTLIEGVNKYEYCKSNVTMNWWSAFAWCKAQGRELFSITDCAMDSAATEYSPGEGICHNLAGKGTDADWVWISLARDNSYAYFVGLSLGAIEYDYRSYTGHHGYLYALCK